MALEIVSLVLSIISVILAVVAIWDSRKINQETSVLLTRIDTFSKNINDRAMGWVEQLMFNKNTAQENNEKTIKDSTTKIKTKKSFEEEILNYLFEKKGATFEEIKKDLNLDFATTKLTLKRLLFGSLIRAYMSEKDVRIYFVPETKDEAQKKYKEKTYADDLPF